MDQRVVDPNINPDGLPDGPVLGSSTQSSGQNKPHARPYFDINLVVSLDRSGKPLSRYGDTSWDLSAQSSDETSTVNLFFFASPPTMEPADAAQLDLAAQIREEHKALIWLHMDAGKIRSQGSIKHSNHALGAWGQKAYVRGMKLFDLLSDPAVVGEEVGTLNASYAEQSRPLIKTLWRHRGELRLKTEVRLKELKAAITQNHSKQNTPERQTPLIPSRIYCAILGSLIISLDDIDRDIEILLDAHRQSLAANRAVLHGSTPMQKRTFRAKTLNAVVDRMKSYGYNPRTMGALDKFIVGQINRCQSMLMNLVIAFTGMRVGEANVLPLYDVLESFDDLRGTHYVVKGYTKKLNGGIKKDTTWITSREGHRAILLAQRIASTILHEVTDGRPSKDREALLFCSIKNPYKRQSQHILYKSESRLVNLICPAVTQDDIDELNRLELDRGWQLEGIEVGKPWPLAFHQLRRSLSVYAHRSGMVSLPALKAQLQHITDEMRAYYSDGFSRAVNLVFDLDHFSHEWNAAKTESSYIGYSMGLLFSDEDLMGQGVARMNQTTSSRSRKETLQLFREGKIAYRETVLGGCTSIEECKARPLEPIPFDCLESNCVNLVVHGKRLDLVISSQEAVVATLERDAAGSVEHRLEANHLGVLLKARQKFKEVSV